MTTAAGVAGGMFAAGAIRDLLGGGAHASAAGAKRDHETLARQDAQDDAEADLREQDARDDAEADADAADDANSDRDDAGGEIEI